ncbi:hypothetical protein [Niveispirillum fermenti]|uniref:hypothetical protein n=1 Tax=Niveispirillum fermenti TaxID=1233113 RepID=UPI003A86262B
MRAIIGLVIINWVLCATAAAGSLNESIAASLSSFGLCEINFHTARYECRSKEESGYFFGIFPQYAHMWGEKAGEVSHIPDIVAYNNFDRNVTVNNIYKCDKEKYWCEYFNNQHDVERIFQRNINDSRISNDEIIAHIVAIGYMYRIDEYVDFISGYDKTIKSEFNSDATVYDISRKIACSVRKSMCDSEYIEAISGMPVIGMAYEYLRSSLLSTVYLNSIKSGIWFDLPDLNYFGWGTLEMLSFKYGHFRNAEMAARESIKLSKLSADAIKERRK